jgi:hypothetical protein
MTNIILKCIKLQKFTSLKNINFVFATAELGLFLKIAGGTEETND